MRPVPRGTRVSGTPLSRLLRKPGAEEMHNALSHVELGKPLADDGVAIQTARAGDLGERTEAAPRRGRVLPPIETRS